MTKINEPISPLRQRMIEDMAMRKLAPKTQSGYIRAIKNFTRYLGRPPDTATAEDLRRYQLHMVESGTSSITLNATVTALRFFFQTTLERAETITKISTVPIPRKLPVVLNREEAARLIAAAGSPKYQAALSVAYGAGLRAGEVIALKVGDIDSTRMSLFVEQGKGKKDRYAMLSPVLLETLRAWWHFAHAQHLMLKGGWLFPGQNPINHIGARQLNRACHAAAQDAGINKRVSMHTLRHNAEFRIIPSRVLPCARYMFAFKGLL
jgi:integrase/recombinase XerD